MVGLKISKVLSAKAICSGDGFLIEKPGQFKIYQPFSNNLSNHIEKNAKEFYF